MDSPFFKNLPSASSSESFFDLSKREPLKDQPTGFEDKASKAFVIGTSKNDPALASKDAINSNGDRHNYLGFFHKQYEQRTLQAEPKQVETSQN